ncbi:Cytochrome P450 [Corchorus olitorius]|uniref:Cytochrome P450 n=1 Tax=Corchorus olitorius TaxID=93759 RepID=A0A1R3KT64_9ROSI|nr:Cytochrome P450 [Corchorus olitorius]
MLFIVSSPFFSLYPISKLNPEIPKSSLTRALNFAAGKTLAPTRLPPTAKASLFLRFQFKTNGNRPQQ